jgi:predicted MFS family arabinose efflux permease
MAIGIFFDAARTAALPDTVSREDLPDAYALSAATWSLTLCLGSLAGGFLVHWLGVAGAFAFDAATYGLSACFLIGVKLPAVPVHPDPFRWRDIVLLKEMKRALEHARERGVGPILWAKTFWGAAGGYLVLLSLAGRDRFGLPEGGGSHVVGADEIVGATAVATGALYAARGVGTGIGPFLANRLLGKGDAGLRRQITAGFVTAAIGYALFGFSHDLRLACFFVAVAHLGGSTIWVASSVLWQRHVGDAYRGRVFAVEFLTKDVAFVAGGLLGGAIYDSTGSLAESTSIVSALVLILGGTWTWLAARGQSSKLPRVAPLEPSDDAAIAAEKAQSPARRGW